MQKSNREPILQNEDDIETVMKFSEGNSDALKILMDIMMNGPNGFLNLLELDDMNIRGAQLCTAFFVYNGGHMELFKKCIIEKDPKMIDCINIVTAKTNSEEIPHKAVLHGASAEKGYPVLDENEIKTLSSKKEPINPLLREFGEN